MEISSNSNHWEKNRWDEVFQEYLVSCKPKEKTKASFGRLLGFLNYTDLKKNGGDWNEPSAEEAITKCGNLKLYSIFKQQAFFLKKDKTLFDCLELLHAIGTLTKADLDDFKAQGINKKSPLSLKQIIKHEISTSGIENLNLTNSEVSYFIKEYWSDLQSSIKILLISDSSIQFLDPHELLTIYLDVCDIYVNEKLTSTSWDKVKTNNAEDALILCSKLILKKNLNTCEELFNNIKSTLAKYHDLPDEELYIHFAKITEAASKEDMDAIAFFKDHCQAQKLSKRVSENRGFGWNYSSDNNHRQNISTILRNKSPLASPILASYLLHNLGDYSFDIERLYACLYVIQKEPALSRLSQILESVEKLNESLRYSNEDLKNNIISAYLIAERARDIQDKNGVSRYAELLGELNCAEQYQLVLAEGCRFIELGVLKLSSDIFTPVFVDALNRSDNRHISQLSELEVEAAAIYATKNNIPLGPLSVHVTDQTVEKTQLLKESWVTRILAAHSDKGLYARELLNALNSQRYDMSDISYYLDKSFFWMMSLCDSVVSTSEIEFNINRHTALNLKDSRHRSSDYQLDINSLPIKHKKILENLGVTENYNQYSSQDIVAFDFFCKNNITSKKNTRGYLCNQSNIICIVEGTLHCFGAPDNEIVRTMMDHEVSKIILYKARNIQATDKKGNPVWSSFYEKSNEITRQTAKIQTIIISPVDSSNIKNVVSVIDYLETLELFKYQGNNPINKIATKLVPKFFFMNKAFNNDGTDYSQ